MTNPYFDGGPAFPVEGHGPGMSLRDYFAGQVLPGCCDANPEPGKAVEQAYIIADAMLAARAKAVGQ